MTPRAPHAVDRLRRRGHERATALVANALRSDLVFFYSPSQVAAKESPAGRAFRLGGLVERGRLARDGTTLRFRVSDTVRKVPVRFDGVVPGLSEGGKGVVVQGQVNADGVFVARELLARHAANYQPPAAGEALARARAGQMLVGVDK
jgi:cytochrome c-type biogenesis protein CcmE